MKKECEKTKDFLSHIDKFVKFIETHVKDEAEK